MRVLDIKNLNHSILPTKYDEQYRSFDLSKLYEKEFNFKLDKKFKKQDYKHLENNNFYNIFYFNNQLHLNGLDDFFEIKEQKLTKSKNPLYSLNSYLEEIETTLIIKKLLDKPLNIINVFEDKNSFYYQNLNLVFEKNTFLLETFFNKNLEESLLSINRNYEIKKDLNVCISKIQLLNKASIITNYLTKIEENSTLEMINLDYESKLALNIFDSKLEYENSCLQIDGVVKIQDKQKIGNIVFIEHLEKETKSDIKIKHLLDDKAHALFDVTSTVQNSASFSQAFQNSQTILLSNDARINANPRLEIYIDELQASHGASTGTLNEDELYYLCSRGISKQKAKKMIIDSIELQVIKKIDNKNIRRYIRDLKRINYV